MGALLFFFLLLGFLFAFYFNRDLFSPVKFYFLALGAYFYYIFFLNYSLIIYVVYLYYVLFGYVLVVIESVLLSKLKLSKCNVLSDKPALPNEKYVLWFLSMLVVLSLLLNLYIIKSSGGFAVYINQLHLRVVNDRGEGYLLVWRKAILDVFLVVLLLVILYKVQRLKLAIFLIFFAFLSMIFIGLLTASRGSILNGVVFFVVCFHYLIRRIRLSRFLLFFAALLVIAMFIGEVRQQIRYSESGLDIQPGYKLSILHSSSGQYGIVPLEGVLGQNYTDLKYGSTYLSAITNFIPRKIWPDKLDTGGVVLTKFMVGNIYTGTTNHSTGYVAEAIINFGYTFGFLLVIFVMLSVSCAVILVYREFLMTLYRQDTFSKLKWIAIYCLSFRLIGALLVGEFTATVDTLIILLLFLYMIMFVLKRLISIKSYSPVAIK